LTRLIFQALVAIKWVRQFSAVLFVTTTKCIAKGAQNTRSVMLVDIIHTLQYFDEWVSVPIR
jgi:hypothetical protein